ncbi:MAG: hypothetical protein ABFD17_06850 [Anaerolineaceae bacterium]
MDDDEPWETRGFFSKEVAWVGVKKHGKKEIKLYSYVGLVGVWIWK